MRAIEVYADVVCPFAYVFLRQLTERREALGAQDVPIVLRSWPLELVNGVPHDSAAIEREIAALRGSIAPDLFAAGGGVRVPESTLAPLALVAALNARGPEVGEGVAYRQRELLFEEGVDIADPVVLGAL